MNKRIKMIKEALEVNHTKALIIEDLIKDIPDDKLIDFFKFRLSFVDRYMSAELITKKAIYEYQKLVTEAKLKRGVRVFEDIKQLKKYLLEHYKGEHITNCGGDDREDAPFMKFVVISLDDNGRFINGYTGRPLTAYDEVAFLKWLLKHQHRIGYVDYNEVSDIDTGEQGLEQIEYKQKNKIENKEVNNIMSGLADKIRGGAR